MTQPQTHLQTYQQNALRTEKPLPTPLERLEHADLGFITEVGEIATEVKRMAIYGKPLDDTRRRHIAEEVGDVLWYLAIGSDALGLNIFEFIDQVPATGNDLAQSVRYLAIAQGRISWAVEVSNLENCGSVSVEKELRAMLAELVNISAMIGISLEQIAGENIAKLRERFPDAYSNEAAEARADKGGLDARNS